MVKKLRFFESDSDLETVQMSQYLRLFQTIEMIDKYIRDEKSLMTYELIVAEEKTSLYGYKVYRFCYSKL